MKKIQPKQLLIPLTFIALFLIKPDLLGYFLVSVNNLLLPSKTMLAVIAIAAFTRASYKVYKHRFQGVKLSSQDRLEIIVEVSAAIMFIIMIAQNTFWK